MIKVAVAEDNPSLARALEENLRLGGEVCRLLYIASNGLELLEMVRQEPPDLVLMDISMPVMNGIEATKKIKLLYPGVKVIMLTVFDDGDHIFESILAGATGYVLKDEKPARLFSAMEEAMEGGAPMSPSIAQKTLLLIRGKRAEPVPDENDYSLSKREIEILDLLSQGLDYNKIADKAFISPKTVRKHIENIYTKLQAHNKVEAISIARKNKLI
jgi:DNA-binding NarL/FixJ family response regulator